MEKGKEAEMKEGGVNLIMGLSLVALCYFHNFNQKNMLCISIRFTFAGGSGRVWGLLAFFIVALLVHTLPFQVY